MSTRLAGLSLLSIRFPGSPIRDTQYAVVARACRSLTVAVLKGL